MTLIIVNIIAGAAIGLITKSFNYGLFRNNKLFIKGILLNIFLAAIFATITSIIWMNK